MSYVLGNAKTPGYYLNFPGTYLIGTWRRDEATVWPDRQAASSRRKWAINVHTDVIVVKVCESCQRPMDAGTPGCTVRHIDYDGGISLDAILHDGEMRCSSCQCKRGRPHHPGCDLAKCPNCGGLLISCDCK